MRQMGFDRDFHSCSGWQEVCINRTIPDARVAQPVGKRQDSRFFLSCITYAYARSQFASTQMSALPKSSGFSSLTEHIHIVLAPDSLNNAPSRPPVLSSTWMCSHEAEQMTSTK